MLELWEQINSYVFVPYSKYINVERTTLKALHKEITNRDYSGWLTPELQPRQIQLRVDENKLAWDAQECRQAISLVFARAPNIRIAVARLPRRIFPHEALSPYPPIQFSPEEIPTDDQVLSPKILEKFDHYLGLRVILNC